ncbi:hypothetical protein DOTSEDRAFT_70453 [Dothistroma septosporum NZE10]|uniref:Developmental regulatory protein wetA n=1 Tax=Dothistroma septosporum (strain NZE10 / CBS 128990) TaxID=675120 RepID=N1PVR9_DOTSN|nr:hypothetical protein DOTSEDRAFT_70453 [Dothistroma septosporum NZE10]
MAAVDHKHSYHIRPTNKEPDFSSLCDNVFDQYLDGDDLFALDGIKRERSSSDGSGNLFNFSGSSEQSNQTSVTSPIPSREEKYSVVESIETEAKQPKAKAPGDFWTRKLRALEQNAAECEERQQRLRSTKSYGDFLSLGGHPSPPALPSSPTGQSYSLPRQRSRPTAAANGRKTPTQRSVTNARSISRGRPMGVTKPPTSAAAHPFATVRKSRDVSPSKMMNPSRYRAGFKDVWAERIQNSPKKYELRLASHTFPDSPPPSARTTQDAFAAFGSPIAYASIPGCDDQISPLASTFQHAARLHTPITSPLLSPRSHAVSSYFEPAPPLPANPYALQSVSLNDTAPFYLDNSAQLAANRIQSFDFGFPSSPSVVGSWITVPPFAEPASAPSLTDAFTTQDAFIGLDDNDTFGLGISCNPNMVSDYTAGPDTSFLSQSAYQPTASMAITSPFYVPSCPNGLPISPTRSYHRNPNTPSRRILHSPSAPATESRSRPASTSRRASRHQRTKSTNSTPRHPQKDVGGGFVNFTPSDSNKILSGVAPSGSSKTKARREKEADDKRRRLSQAAMRAVIEAGGDVETLQRAGLIAG